MFKKKGDQRIVVTMHLSHKLAVEIGHSSKKNIEETSKEIPVLRLITPGNNNAIDKHVRNRVVCDATVLTA